MSEFEREMLAATESARSQTYVLRLYVAGINQRSNRAVFNVRNLCEKYLKGRYQLQVVDIYQQPELAKSANLIAAPTLIKELPVPLRRLVGDFSDIDRVLVGLNIVPGASE